FKIFKEGFSKLNKKIVLLFGRTFFFVIILIVPSRSGFINFPLISEFQKNAVSYPSVILVSATPCFIMLSEMLLVMRYSNYIPKTFLTKRIKFLLVPYLFFTLFVIFEIYFSPSKHFTL
ncbi:acyltransferase family protein, partial [Staphylococcus simulans]